MGIGKNHASQADKIDLAVAQVILGHVGQIFLQIGIGRADQQHVRESGLQFSHDLNLARDGNKRVLVRLNFARPGDASAPGGPIGWDLDR